MLVAAFPRRSAVGGIVEPNILALRLALPLTICGEVQIGGSSENGDHASHSVFQRSQASGGVPRASSVKNPQP